MSPQLISLVVTRDHAVPIEPIGGTAIVQVDSTGGTVFYADNPQVSAAQNQGSIAPGASQTFTSNVWVVSNATAGVQVQITSGGPYTAQRFRKQITVDHTKVAGSLSGFVASLDLSADTDIAGQANPDLSDVRFTDGDLNPLAYEIESQGGVDLFVDASWVWFQNPRAVCYKGTHNRVYVSLVTSSGTVAALQYDVDTKVTTTFALHSAFSSPPDDHNVAGLLVLPSGRIMAFYSNSDTGDGKLRTRVSTNPEDISAWGVEVATQVTGVSSILEYATPHYLTGEGTGSGRIYLFFNDRGGTGGISYITSDDLGTTWSTVTSVANPVLPNINYASFADNGVDRIDIAFTDNPPLAPGTSGQQVGPSDLFHVFVKGGNLCRTDGTVLSSLASLGSTGLSTATLQAGGAQIAAYNSATGPYWTWDIAYDASGNPQMVYVTYPAAGGNTDWTGQIYNWAGWNGSKWVFSKITPAGNWISPIATAGGTFNWAYSGGIAIMPGTSTTVYLSREVAKQGCYDGFEIEKWVGSSGGTGWTRVASVTPGSRRKNVRPVVPRNRQLLSTTPPEILFLSGGYTHYQSASQSLMAYPPPAGSTVKKGARVVLPTIDTVADKTVYMYYGNPTAVDASGAVFDANMQAAQPLVPRSSPTNIYEHASALNMTGWTAFTLSVWANLAVGGNDGVGDYLFSNIDQSGSRVTPSIRLSVTSGVPGADFLVNNGSNVLVGGAFPDKTGLHDGNWHHYALTWDATTLKLYVDGVVSSTTYTSPSNHMSGTGNSSQAAMLGWSPNVATRRIDGSLSDFYLSNAVQSVAWIQTQAKARTGTSVLTTVNPTPARQW